METELIFIYLLLIPHNRLSKNRMHHLNNIEASKHVYRSVITAIAIQSRKKNGYHTKALFNILHLNLCLSIKDKTNIIFIKPYYLPHSHSIPT